MKDNYLYDVSVVTIKGVDGTNFQVPYITKVVTKEYGEILNQIEYAQDILDRCKEIIADDKEINKLNKLHMRINTVNDRTYDIMGIIEELQK